MSSTGPVEFEGVESALSKNLSGLELDNVTRILYGRSHPSLSLAEASLAAEQGNFELKSFTVTANPEQTRAPRRIRVAAIQNAIVLPTTASVVEQRDAIHRRVGEIIEAAGAAGVNIICLQEAWTMPFAFCTRERLPWTEFAESAETGPSTKFLSQRVLHVATATCITRRHNIGERPNPTPSLYNSYTEV